MSDSSTALLAYLVIREGSKWTDVFRLIPGQSVTVGRAPTNQIVIKDERCSRCHAELFITEGRWTLRDLDSRNGTSLGGTLIQGDVALTPGDVIRIGNSQLAFVHDLSKAFPDSSGVGALGELPTVDAMPGVRGSETSVVDFPEPATITHRRGQTKFLEPGDDDEAGVSKEGRAAAKLYRLACELAKAPDAVSMTKLALGAMFEGTQMDAGGLLLLRRGVTGEPTSADLELVASRTDTDVPYHRISPILAATVLREGEAVLARNVMGDSTLQSRDSKGDMHATSVICAPIRRGKKAFGLVHLYSTASDQVPDPDDLEFTLAAADAVALAMQNLNRRQELAENLNQIRDENVQLRERLGVQSEIVGRSKVMERITEEIARAAPTSATVLIRGESGVGKELVARAVHYSSPRRKGAFNCLNCAALSESLLESELFGHERGAFTGAVGRKIGKFEASHQGTLMLDEIGEMSPTIQAKFLRVLEGHSFERVGGSEPVKVDVRLIAATNRDLEKDVAEGRFRRDLYFRLHVLEIVVPALRKRPEDIPELANYFFHKYNLETGRRLRGFTPRAMEQMVRYRWPGNVRELKNVVERAIVLAEDEYIDVQDLMLSKLPTTGDTGEAPPVNVEFKPVSLAEMERRHILATLKATGWNKSQAAQVLGIERSTLDRKIRRYELAEFLPGRVP
ncbi:MAG TPA: sigma 54-interacting transcriptional regulator [Pirellulales bacterium]|nr:sigma 54-interacting transcriptional regulator [Pirellulales bacterium]